MADDAITQGGMGVPDSPFYIWLSLKYLKINMM